MKQCAGGFLRKGDRILLGKRAANRKLAPNQWDAIGGHCLPGEEPSRTLIRELQEEIGVTPKKFEELAVLFEQNPEIYGEIAYHLFLVTDWVGEGPMLMGEEHSEIAWFALDEACQLDLAHPVYSTLFEAMRQ